MSQVTAIMLNFEEEKRHLALPMHGLLVNGGGPLLSITGPTYSQDKPLMAVSGIMREQDLLNICDRRFLIHRLPL